MTFEKHFPNEQLKPYIKYYVVSENEQENEYKVFPSTGMVIGFQYKGSLNLITNSNLSQLNAAGITGMTDTHKTFQNSANIGTVLVYFSEIGFTHFASHPANELFNMSLSLEHIFDLESVEIVKEKLALANNDARRIKIVEQFLLSHLKHIQTDKLILKSIHLIYQSKGAMRIKELIEKLNISQSPFEKRFRKTVGTSPKKFASIVRFNTVLDQMNQSKSLIEICYENNFFDQAHFIKDFKQYTGETPEKFKRF
ncbi:MAG TPA: helix-turn-helix domain-containing protein [Bacteroidia bacterium]